jgi:hypothetical protein
MKKVPTLGTTVKHIFVVKFTRCWMWGGGGDERLMDITMEHFLGTEQKM